eukprot:scaffold7375_cov98-Skeletonema_marinoi.AAC.4
MEADFLPSALQPSIIAQLSATLLPVPTKEVRLLPLSSAVTYSPLTSGDLSLFPVDPTNK